MKQFKRLSIKRRHMIVITLIVVMLAIVIFMVQFTKEGYRMTVPYRDFNKLSEGVYLHQGYTGDLANVMEVTAAARVRVTEFFGELQSTPTIIICDDPAVIKKLGGDHDTMTIVFFRAFNYIAISSDYLNVDIVAHEMTHAEVHTRLYKGKISNRALVPIWFDEGVAMQNDNRENYNEDAWARYTNHGEHTIELSAIDTPAKYYAGEVEDRRARFAVSRHELSEWIDRNGIAGLLELLDQVNEGRNFNDVYYK